MDKYISRKELIEKIRHMPRTVNPDLVQYSLVKWIVAGIETADVAPVVYGKWVKQVYIDPYGADWTKYHCSLCGRVEIKKEPYCNCGAMMDLEEE